MNVKTGQQYRLNEYPDHGDIVTYTVISVGKRVAMIRNNATLKEHALLQSEESDFLSDFHLLTV